MKYPNWFAMLVCVLSGFCVVSFLGMILLLNSNKAEAEMFAQQKYYEEKIHQVQMDYALERENVEVHYAELICELEGKLKASEVKTGELESFIQSMDIVNKPIVLAVTRTAYTASRDECDSTPHITATGTKPKVGRTIAVSRDLFEHLKHRKVYIEGLGVFTIEDTMNERYTNRVDLLVSSKSEAKKIGIGKVKMMVLPEKV